MCVDTASSTCRGAKLACSLSSLFEYKGARAIDVYVESRIDQTDAFAQRYHVRPSGLLGPNASQPRGPAGHVQPFPNRRILGMRSAIETEGMKDLRNHRCPG